MRHLLLAMALVGAGELSSQSPLPKKQVVEDLRLDATTEDFPGVGTVMVGPHGQMAVLISDDHQLRFYDATGRKTGIFGRTGSGPGEFQLMNRHGWIGDTLWIYDVNLRRVTYVSPAGTLLRTELMSGSLNTIDASRGGPPGVGTVGLYAPAAVVEGRYVGMALVMAGRDADGVSQSIQRIMSVPVGDSTGTRDRRFLADGPVTSGTSVRYRSDDGILISTVIPFTFSPATVFSPDGSRFANITTEVGDKGGTWTIEMFSTKGDTLFRRAYPFRGTPIPSSVRDSALNRVGVGSNGRPRFSPQTLAKLREVMQPKMPKVYSPVSSMILGSDGTAWISGRITPQGRTVTAIDAKGNPWFTVDLPPKTRLVQANRMTLWAVQTDADDLPSVVRYRIR